MDPERMGTRVLAEKNVEMLKVIRDVDGLVQVLTGGEEEAAARARAAEALGEIGDKRAILPLVSVLNDSSRTIREQAAVSLVKFRSAAVPKLTAALTEPDTQRKVYATGVLGKIGGKKSIPPLIKALGDTDPDVRCAAAGSLAQIGADTLPALIKVLNGKDEKMKPLAAAALAKIGDIRAADSLVGLFSSDTRAVRDAAAGAIVALGKDAVPPVLRALRESPRTGRIYAASVLGFLGGREALAALNKNENDPDPEIRTAVHEAQKRLNELKK
jgi:HEAT repeat protein